MSRKGATIFVITLAAAALLLCAIPALASAEWSGEATLDSGPVGVNFMERFEVTVTNHGPEPIEVLGISVTVYWGMPTTHQVFDGSAVLQPGESRTFQGPPTRMPTVEPEIYQAMVSVTARGADGMVLEKQFPGTLDVYVFGISFLGIPEEILIPIALAGIMLLITLALFRFERVPGWPLFRSTPRWRRRS